MKNLNQDDFHMEIIEDLGMVHETTVNPIRTAIFKCECGELEQISTNNAKHRVTCRKCSKQRQRNKLSKSLDPSKYTMRLIKDLGNLPVKGSDRLVRFALFECPSCLKHFKTRATGKAAQKQTRCQTCVSSCARGTDKQLYSIWNTIKQRCYNPKRKDYHRYGGKGVVMHQDWVDSPTKFIEWCETNGWAPDLVIDKDIKSAELGINPPIYSPETVSFITTKQNSRAANAKAVTQFSLDGVKLATFSSCVEAAEAVGHPKGKSAIALCCRGGSHTSYGFKWSFN